MLPKWLKHHNCKDQLSVQKSVRKIMYRNIRILQNIFNLSVHCSNLSSDKTADEQQYRLSQSAPTSLFLNKHEGMQQRLNLRKNCSLTVHLRSIDLASQICTLLKAQENHCSIFEKLNMFNAKFSAVPSMLPVARRSVPLPGALLNLGKDEETGSLIQPNATSNFPRHQRHSFH